MRFSVGAFVIPLVVFGCVSFGNSWSSRAGVTNTLLAPLAASKDGDVLREWRKDTESSELLLDAEVPNETSMAVASSPSAITMSVGARGGEADSLNAWLRIKCLPFALTCERKTCVWFAY